MSERASNNPEIDQLRKSYPDLTPQQIAHLIEQLDWYFEFAMRIYMRRRSDRKSNMLAVDTNSSPR